MTSNRYPIYRPNALALLLATLCLSGSCFGQIAVMPGELEAENPDLSLPLLPTDRTLSRGIRKAEQRIREGEFTQAIRFLDEVLQPQQEDYFVDSGKSGEHSGLKETARRMIRELPADGRELYEATYGPVASRELEQARSTGDMDSVRSIAFRYFHTDAGYEAALLLAQDQSDLGRHLSAALIFRELLSSKTARTRLEPQLSLLAASAWRAAGEPDEAASILRDLAQTSFRSVRVGGREVPVREMASNPLGWLEQRLGPPSESVLRPRSEWLTSRGNARRNAEVRGGLPHMRERWAVRLLDHPALEEHHESILVDKTRQKKPLAVAASPLAVGDYVITRSAHNLVAVDYRTGKRVWRSQPQRVEAFQNLSAEQDALTEVTAESPLQKLNERVWKDHLYNSFSSDGDRIYVIRDLTINRDFEMDVFGGMPIATVDSRISPAGSNRLCAYELASEGKLVWEIDGASARSDLPGAFFLGAPLWVGQSLYGLVEIKSAVYLVAIDRRSGKLQWKQQLVGLEANILLDQKRRLFAAVPSYDSGILVCTTGAGVVVGVDLAKQSLAWAYRYENHPGLMFSMRGRRRLATAEKSHWDDPSTIIADGKVLLSPHDSDKLHCLDLISGKLIWSLDRDKALSVAGVNQGRVLLIGQTHLLAVSLEDGSTAWPVDTLKLEPGAEPSGHGFFSAGKYYLPLSTAEVIAIDMADGNVVARSASRDGRVLGNLICHRGAVLSQTGRFLDCYDLVEVLRKNAEQSLLADQDDVDALRVLGEIAYNDGDLELAIDYLQSSLAGAGENLRTKEVLMECLEVALEEDFAAYQDQLPLLRELHASVDSNQQNLLRIEAQGLFATGDLEGSAEACLKLYEELAATDQMLAVRRDYHTSLTSWLHCQMNLIWKEGDAEQRESIRRATSTFLASAEANSSNGELDRFVACFAALDASEPALMQIAEENYVVGEALDAQQFYLDLMESADPSIRAKATARCSQMLHEREFGQLAISFDQRIAEEFADAVCLDGMTGSECLATWAKRPAVSASEWPYGQVKVGSLATKSDRIAKRIRAPQSRIPFERTDDVLGRCTALATSRTAGDVELLDSLGNRIFRASNEQQHRIRTFDDGSNSAVSRGNLLIVSHGTEIHAYDTLSTSSDEQEGKLWKVKVAQGLSYENRIIYRGVIRGRDRRRFAPSKPSRAQHDNQWIGVLGPLSRESFVYQDQRRLVCVDPLTGKVKWWRSDVPLGCDLYGDGEYLFVVPRNNREALVFSTIDGRRIGKVNTPGWHEQLATIGRRFIRWDKQATGEQELSSIDILHGDVQWKLKFQRGARVDITQGRYVAVLEPDGDCVVVDAYDGTVLAEGAFPRSNVLKEVHVQAGSDSFVVVREQPFTPSRTRQIRSLNANDYRVMEGSLLVLDRKTGKSLWRQPVEVKQEAFILSQPVDLPLLAFAGTVSNRTKSGGRPATSMIILEKASGRLLFADDKLPQAAGNYCRISAVQPGEPVVQVEMASRTIRLEFTGEPRPPEPPASIGGASQRKKESDGLFGIGRKIIGQD